MKTHTIRRNPSTSGQLVRLLLIVVSLLNFSPRLFSGDLPLPKAFQDLKGHIDYLSSSPFLSAKAKTTLNEVWNRVGPKLLDLYTRREEAIKEYHSAHDRWELALKASMALPPSTGDDTPEAIECDAAYAAYKKASEKFDTAYKLLEPYEPEMWEALNDLTKCAYRKCQPGEEEQGLRKLKVIAGGSIDFDWSLKIAGSRVVDTRNAEVPVTSMPEELKQSPGSREARKGYQCMEQHDWAAAKAWFQQALLKDPNNEILKNQVAICDRKGK